MTTYTPKYRPDRRSILKGAGAAMIGLTMLPRFSMGAEEKKLNLYNWDTYIGENTLAQFKEATGIETKMDLFADNDELFAKMKEGNPGYDIIVPTNDYVERMLLAKMLMPIDHSKIPNMSNLEADFQDSTFDPGRKHTVPYMWGTQGLGYRKSKVKGGTDSWKIVLDSGDHAGRIAWLGDAGSMIGIALKYLGYSYNSKDPAELKKAEELLLASKKNVKVFADDNGQDLLASGEVDIAVEWNGDILQVMGEDDDVSYQVPNEGGLVWQDCMCIPNGAPHPENAHAFLNHILDAKVGSEIADYIQYATPNGAAKAMMSDKYKNNPGIFPSAETLAKCESGLYLGEEATKVRDEIWTRVQAA